MTVYMIFKYSKRFRYAPSFNKELGPKLLAYPISTQKTQLLSQKIEVSQLDIDQILVQTPQGTETLILDTYRNS